MALGCGNSILACQGRRDDGGPLRRCYLKGRVGDAANVALSAVGHNFHRILAGISLPLILIASQPSTSSQP
jgi:hypothetical protein